MELPDYIDEIGLKRFAARFHVAERTALSWKYRARRPRPEIASRIVARSPVTWEGIYGPQKRAS